MALLFSAVILSMPNQAQTNNTNQEKNNTMQQNKERVRQLFETVLNQRKYDQLENYISADYTGPNGGKGVEGFKAQVTDLLKANPDLQWTILELIAEGNKVWARWTTSTGQQSGKPVTTTGIGTYHLSNGKITQSFALVDRLSFFQQKGILPVDLNILQAKANPQKLIFIDKFIVPAASLNEFKERVRINRALVRAIHGFIEDAAYESIDANGNTLFVTVAEWASEEALQKAKEAVQESYKKEGFDILAMMKRLNITLDRAVYKPASVH